jgi:hypothetical protein
MNNWSSSFKIDFPKIFINSFKLIILFSILYLTLLVLAGVIRQNFPAFTRGAAGERMDLLLGKSEKSAIAEDTGSGGGRGDLLFKYVDTFVSNPFGSGTGFSSDKNFNHLNTHNHYLFLAVNYGIFGLFAFIFFLGYSINFSISMNQFYTFIFFFLLVFEGLIAHNIFSERAILVSLAFFDSLLYRKLNH